MPLHCQHGKSAELGVTGNPWSLCVSSIQQRHGAPGHQIIFKHSELSLRSFPCPHGSAGDFLSWPTFLLMQLPRAKRTVRESYKHSSQMFQLWYQNEVPPFSYQASFEANRVRSRAANPGGQHNFLTACTLWSHKNLQMSSHTSPLCLWKSTWAPEIWPCVKLPWLLSAERKQGPGVLRMAAVGFGILITH